LGIITLEPERWFRLAKPGVLAPESGKLETTGDGAVLSDGDASSNASGAGSALTDADVEALIAARNAARKAKDFAESDRIRDQLAAAGVIVEDKPGGKSTWRRA
jgi:cysteinyl-tRNA synthetase